MTEAPEDRPLTIAVDGEKFTMADLTFRERRDLRALARELADDPDLDMEDVMYDDLILAFAIVAHRRKTPGYSIEDGLDLQIGSLVVDESSEDSEKPRPTKRRAATAK